MFAIALLLAVSAPQAQEPPPDQLPEFYERSLGSPIEALAWLDLPEWARHSPLQLPSSLFSHLPRSSGGDAISTQFQLEAKLWEHAAVWPSSYWSMLFSASVIDKTIENYHHHDTSEAIWNDAYGKILNASRTLPDWVLDSSGNWISRDAAIESILGRMLLILPWGRFGAHPPYAALQKIAKKKEIRNPLLKYITVTDAGGGTGVTSRSRFSYYPETPRFVLHGWRPGTIFPSLTARNAHNEEKLFGENGEQNFIFISRIGIETINPISHSGSLESIGLFLDKNDLFLLITNDDVTSFLNPQRTYGGSPTSERREEVNEKIIRHPRVFHLNKPLKNQVLAPSYRWLTNYKRGLLGRVKNGSVVALNDFYHPTSWKDLGFSLWSGFHQQVMSGFSSWAAFEITGPDGPGANSLNILTIEGLYAIPRVDIWNADTGKSAKVEIVEHGPLQLTFKLLDKEDSRLVVAVRKVHHFPFSSYPYAPMAGEKMKPLGFPGKDPLRKDDRQATSHLNSDVYHDRKTDNYYARLYTDFEYYHQNAHSKSPQLAAVPPPSPLIDDKERRRKLPNLFWGIYEALLRRTQNAVSLWERSNPPKDDILTRLAQSQAMAALGNTPEAYELLNRSKKLGKKERKYFLKEWLLANWAIENSSYKSSQKHLINLINSLARTAKDNEFIIPVNPTNRKLNGDLEEWVRFSIAEKLLEQGYLTSSRQSLENLYQAFLAKGKLRLAARTLQMIFSVHERAGNISRIFDQIGTSIGPLLSKEGLPMQEVRGVLSTVVQIALRSKQVGSERANLLKLRNRFEIQNNISAARKDEILKELDAGVFFLSGALAQDGTASNYLAEKIEGQLRGINETSATASGITSLLEKLTIDLGDSKKTVASTPLIPSNYDAEMGRKIRQLGELLLEDKLFEKSSETSHFARQILAASYGESSLAVLECEGLRLRAQLEMGEVSKVLRQLPTLIKKVRAKGASTSGLELNLRANLARALLESGNSKDSLREWERIIRGYKGMDKEDSLELSYFLNGLAEAEIAEKHPEKAIDTLIESLSTASKFLEKNIFQLTEREILRISSNEDSFQRLLNISQKSKDINSNKKLELFQHHLRWKGRAFRTYFFLKQLEKLSGKKARNFATELKEVRAEVSHIFLTGKNQKDKNVQSRISTLSRRRQALELSLNQELEKEGLSATPPNPENGLEHILSQGVLVDFVIAEDQLLVWVVREGADPELLRLGNTENIKEAFVAFRNSMGRDRGGKAITTEKDSPGEKLRKLIWDPLVPYLNNSKRVFLSPDGFLALVPFDALPDGKQVLLEQYTFSRLPDLTWGIPHNKVEAEKNNLLLLADATYGPRNSSGDDFNNWIPLAASKGEVLTIQTLFNEVFPLSNSKILSQENATEKNLRDLIGGQSWVHLATHGFFEPNLGISQSNVTTNLTMEKVARETPGLLAGIVLAGANNGNLGNPNDDGYITAEEFCTLNLQGCRLLTLSACDSSKGKAIPGEGLISMTRAAKQAGAEAILSSLWVVDDFKTKNLMVNFYSNFWNNPKNGAEALRNAKLKMRRKQQDEGADYPEHWAGFVYHGL